jgi:hypothetical protein
LPRLCLNVLFLRTEAPKQLIADSLTLLLESERFH